MAVDKTKLKEGLATALDIGSDVVRTGASLAAASAPIVNQVINGGLDIVSSLLGSSSGSSADYNTPYSPSSTVTQLGSQLESTSKPVQQQSQFQQTLQDTMNAILNKEDFKYDVNADALYNQYKDQYMLGGKMAMQDTMGQAAALTGGYGNSYAQTVGQQQYQSYLQQLNDKIPELYMLARDTYDRDLSNLYNRYGLLSDAEAKEYSRYRDEVADYYADRDYLTNRYYNERDFDYGQWADNRDFSYQQHRDNIADEQWQQQFDREVYESDRNYNRSVYESDRNYDYQVGRDDVSDQQWQAAFDRGVYESDRDYDYRLDRDVVEDARYDAQWQNTLDRQAVEDSRWLKEFALKQSEADYKYGNTEDNNVSQSSVVKAAIDLFKTMWGLDTRTMTFTNENGAKIAKSYLDQNVNEGNISPEEYGYLIQTLGL